MWETIKERLKKIDGIRMAVRNTRSGLRTSSKFITSFARRKPRYYFFKPRIAVIKGGSMASSDQRNREEIASIQEKLTHGLFVYTDVLSYPLGDAKENVHSGGLIDTKTNELIPEAIHFNGAYCQELPPFYEKAFQNPHLPEIQNLVLFGGILYNNFGHFLLESIARLWAYDHVKQLNPYILFYNYWGKPDYLDSKNYIHQVLSGFNIPHEKILFIDYPAKFKTVIIPVQKYGYKLCRQPDEYFMQFINSFKFPAVVPDKFKGAENLYVSRSRLQIGYGKPIGENLFENHLASSGYTIFYPEQFTLYQQLAVYSKAKKIIFCDGSSIHTCILLPKLKAQVAIIARRKDQRWIPSEIADQFEGYGKKISWIDAVQEQYQFGLESWYACAVIDWYEVSSALNKEGFLDSLFLSFKEVDYQSLVRAELYSFMLSIYKNPKFMDFLLKSKE
ncbi:MAG: glycosyltransferase 61 family protein [Chitinophagaceae bacterium]